MDFVYDSPAQRVRFATRNAATATAEELTLLRSQRPMVIVAPAERQLAEQVISQIDEPIFHDEVLMHVPLDVAQRARIASREARVDALVSVGGGSTTGLAKAIALTTGLPIVAVPTTYAGSEATNVWGITENGNKTTGVDARVLPKAIVYDASLTTSLPLDLSVASGLNALAHCVDSMWAPKANPVNRALALEGIRSLNDGLRGLVAGADETSSREELLCATYLAAASFASAGSGLHHKICHVLGGRYNLPHAQTHAAVLPYVLAFNAGAAGGVETRLAEAFRAETSLDGLKDLHSAIHESGTLEDCGLLETEIDDAAAAILPFVPPSNPRPVTVEDLSRLLRTAWAGENPRVLEANDDLVGHVSRALVGTPPDRLD